MKPVSQQARMMLMLISAFFYLGRINAHKRRCIQSKKTDLLYFSVVSTLLLAPTVLYFAFLPMIPCSLSLPLRRDKRRYFDKIGGLSKGHMALEHVDVDEPKIV